MCTVVELIILSVEFPPNIKDSLWMSPEPLSISDDDNGKAEIYHKKEQFNMRFLKCFVIFAEVCFN
jgi:hypothetical protein